ncbi:YbjN domain-containing protein [Lysobacter niastensis]|uniref:YbjN domain-containing protein n=1 Tax=Lysobacter niastensis TaxID=380629 RepID=A0ABS0BDB7_9GAMM|nr:YbjN domain-containing protein [Lysobacter niastensis]MBF6025110.1 YbjN domain-containing protein [Lysobacter niastensis]
MLAFAAEPARGVTAAEVAKILQDASYSAKIGKAGDGTPRIDSNMGGVDVVMDFYDCEADRCGSLQLTTGIDLEKGSTYQVINKFNSEYRYGSAYLDAAMDPFIEYDFEVVNTDHAAYIRSQIELWEEVLGYFIKVIESGDSKPATK